jgi:transposase
MSTRYSDEFKREVVRLYRETGKSYRELASDLGVSSYSIRRWVIEAGGASGDGSDSPSPVEREEIRKLRREVQVLREEREILRKAAAFFAMESRPNRA